MIKYNSDKNFVVQDIRLLEAPIQSLGCRRSESKFVSTLLQEKLDPFNFPFEVKFLRLRRSPLDKSRPQVKTFYRLPYKSLGFSGSL
jgi:hypothetical protein